MMNDLECQEPIEFRGKEKGKLINEWNNWFSSAKKCVINNMKVDLKWSIDRITIVGELRKFIWVRDDLEPIALDFEMVWMVFEEQGVAKQVGNGWVLLDKYGENIAYAERVKFDKTKGRIDFNPNKIRPFLHGELKRFIHNLFDNPHFSRADVACDIVNLSDDFIRQYRIVDPVSFKPIYGANGLLETAYWGSRSSERQVRMYNKKLEQTKKKAIVPKEIENWWRLEVQLRRAKAEEWNSVVFESLDSFSSPHYFPTDMSPIEQAVITGLITNQDLWGRLARTTKYRYRNLLKELSQNDELTQYLKASFSESAKDLKDELDSWLTGLDVTEDESDNSGAV